jgi:hypothetical protein
MSNPWTGVAKSDGKTQAGDAIPDAELPGMWERSDFEGGQDEVRGPDWKRPAGDAGAVLSDEDIMEIVRDEMTFYADGVNFIETQQMLRVARAILASAQKAAVPEVERDAAATWCNKRTSDGWFCSRKPGHEGECNRVPDAAMHPTTEKE